MCRFAAAALAALLLWAAAPAAQQPPKLIVMVVSDQFRGDFLEKFAPHWRAGFRTLLAEGAVFTRAEYAYQETETCPGHFTIGTGAQPRTHGMVGNDWWDPALRRVIECTDDPAAKPVTYGRRSRLGKSPRFLLVPTLADELRAQRPGARVVSLSIKARSAIGLAGRGGDAVTWFEEGANVGSFVTSSTYASSRVREVQRFIQQNPIDREFGRLWELRDPPDRYVNADAGLGERPRAPRLGLFPHATRSTTGNRNESVLLWRESPFSDAYVGRMAIAMIDAFALGQRGTTDFLGVGFSATDTVGHRFGPDSRETEDTAARQDDLIGNLIAHLDQRVGRANYVLAFSADHGVAPVPAGRGGRVTGEDVRERIDEVVTKHLGKAPTRWTVAGGPQPRLAPGVMAKLSATAIQDIIRAVEAIPGVDRLVRPDQAAVNDTDPVLRAVALSYSAGRGGDFVVIPEQYWTVAPRNFTNAAEHGSVHAYDQHVPVILFGGPFKAGRHDGEITPADIAPTLASVAGITLSKADGRVLKEAY